MTDILKGKEKVVQVTPDRLEVLSRRQEVPLLAWPRRKIRWGVVTGLAWTSVGGDLLQTRR